MHHDGIVINTLVLFNAAELCKAQSMTRPNLAALHCILVMVTFTSEKGQHIQTSVSP